MVEESEISLPGGKNFTIRANGLSDGNRYIKSATLNGKALTEPRINHDDIMNGGVLELQMTSEKTGLKNK